MSDLAELNGISANATIHPGQRLIVPTQAYLDAGRRARDNFLNLAQYMNTHGGSLPPDPAHAPSIADQSDPNWRRVAKNGYEFSIDQIQRARKITGKVRVLSLEGRSRRAQGEAGKPDRRHTDDGGHFIAARFNGPRDWFNHFAQDASFNRGAYRALEDKWAKTVQSGKRVLSISCRIMLARRSGLTSSPSPGSSTVSGSCERSLTKKEGVEMSNDRYEKLGPMLADIGAEITNIVAGDPNGTYLYVEAGNGWYGASLFKDEGEIVRYYDPSSELDDLIYDFWLAEQPGKRWAIMEYEVRGTKFDAQFKFPDEVDVESFDIDRREVALKKRYGDKPVIYPPMPDVMG